MTIARRSGLWALPLIGAISIGLMQTARWTPKQQYLGYVEDGEVLLHGTSAPSLFHLPSADVLAALIYSHWPLSPLRRQGVFAALLAILVLVIDGNLGIPTLFGLAPAAAVLLSRAEYPQVFLGLLALLAAGYLIRYAKDPTCSNALPLGAAIGGSFLFRSTMAFLPPVIALVAAAFWIPGRPWARAKQVAVLLLVPYLFLLPALRMNYALHQRFIPFENGEASNIIVSGALGRERTIPGPLEDMLPSPDAFKNGGMLLWAVKEVVRHPLRFGIGVLIRLRTAIEWSSPAIFFALWAFWLRRGRREFQALGLVAAYWIGIHCLMSIERGYFQPPQPLFIILAYSLAGGFVPWANISLPRSVSSAALACSLAGVLVLDLYSVARMRDAGRSTPVHAAALSPDDWWLLEKRGEERLRRGDFPEAAADFSRSLAGAPADLLKGEIGFKLEAQFATAEMFQDHLALAWKLPVDEGRSTDRVTAHLLRAYAWSRAGRPVEAEKEMRSAADGDELAAEFERGLLEAWPLANRTVLAALLASAYPGSAPAAKVYADCLKRGGGGGPQASPARLDLSPGRRRQAAGGFFLAGDFKRALDQLEAIAEPKDADTLIEISRARSGLGQKERAASALAQAAGLRLNPSQRRRMADAYFLLGDFRRALDQLDALARPADVDGLILKARALAALGQKDSAASVLAGAESRASDERRHQIALIYQDLMDYDRALAILKELAADHPGNADFLVSRGVCEYLSGSIDQAENTLQTAVRLDPQFLPAYLNLGYIYEERRRYHQAVELYEHALSLSRDRPRNPLRQAVELALQRTKEQDR